MASSFLKGLVTDYGKLGYQLWHRPLKMASLVYEREIGIGERQDDFIRKQKSANTNKMATDLNTLLHSL